MVKTMNDIDKDTLKFDILPVVEKLCDAVYKKTLRFGIVSGVCFGALLGAVLTAQFTWLGENTGFFESSNIMIIALVGIIVVHLFFKKPIDVVFSQIRTIIAEIKSLMDK